MSGAAPLLALSGLACVRGGRLLFEGLDLVLEPGEAALVTGPNGAGKSSLLRLAAGLLEPARGKVVRNSPLAFADEKLALDAKLPLGRALDFWARIDRVDVSQGIAAMGLGRLVDVPVRLLSTGQRKRAVIARAVGRGVKLWVLDEPLNGLDEEGSERLRKLIDKHRERGGAILVASHQVLDLPGAKAVAL